MSITPIKSKAPKGWDFVRVFADEGITGTSTKHRSDFNKMIDQCKKGKIDLILTKSISRFARNTLDSIQYARMLKRLGIGIIFEKENIDTRELVKSVIVHADGAVTVGFIDGTEVQKSTN